MNAPLPTAPHRTDWHWGALHFDGLMNLHGRYLCFHRYLSDTATEAMVDPTKPVLPLQQGTDSGGSQPASRRN